MTGTGLRSGPEHAAACRAFTRVSQASGASARRLREIINSRTGKRAARRRRGAKRTEFAPGD